MSSTDNKTLWGPWADLWNGNLALADQIIAPDFVAHAAPLTGSGADEVHGRDGLRGWISGIRSVIPDLIFTNDVGPISEGDMLVGRWQARGTYHGGIPGVPVPTAGRPVHFSGTDNLRIANGQLVEYWANADSLLFMQQIGAVPAL